MGMNILYIEDNPDNMLLVKRVLEAGGHRLYQAANGSDGIRTAENENIQLILLDINLPDLDGYEVAGRLRHSSKPTLAHIPIIAITANALKGDAERALSAGCDVYMSKPINIHELRARVEGFAPVSEESSPKMEESTPKVEQKPTPVDNPPRQKRTFWSRKRRTNSWTQ